MRTILCAVLLLFAGALSGPASATSAGPTPPDSGNDVKGSWVTLDSSVKLDVEAARKGAEHCVLTVSNVAEPCDIRRGGNGFAINGQAAPTDPTAPAASSVLLVQLTGQTLVGKIFPANAGVTLYRVGSDQLASALKVAADAQQVQTLLNGIAGTYSMDRLPVTCQSSCDCETSDTVLFAVSLTPRGDDSVNVSFKYSWDTTYDPDICVFDNFSFLTNNSGIGTLSPDHTRIVARLTDDSTGQPSWTVMINITPNQNQVGLDVGDDLKVGYLRDISWPLTLQKQ